MNIEAYFERIGYKNSRDKLDLETLTDILQHQIQAIPFENLNIHCGEAMELDLEVIFDQIVRPLVPACLTDGVPLWLSW